MANAKLKQVQHYQKFLEKQVSETASQIQRDPSNNQIYKTPVRRKMQTLETVEPEYTESPEMLQKYQLRKDLDK